LAKARITYIIAGQNIQIQKPKGQLPDNPLATGSFVLYYRFRINAGFGSHNTKKILSIKKQS